ncbi:MAG TPA: metallophosphoesterase [Candidatus Binatia bacterium]|nr:metallophosphoesterase [Candidatus Binatia bacterium]
MPAYAWWGRGRTYALFGFVILAVSLPGAIVAHGHLRAWAPAAAGPLDAVFAYGMAAATTHLLALVYPRLRTTPFRLAVSIPGMAFVAAGFLAGLWLLALLPVRGVLALLGCQHALALLRPLDLVPFAVTGLSLVTSTHLVPEVVRVPLAADGPAEVARLPVERHRRRPPRPLARRPLRIVQIADPHLGPWQPVALLRRRIAELIAYEPDLILLTGDFLTMEGAATRGALAEALAPLRDHAARAFAILGNHDHECADEVRRALKATGARLLVDTEATVETAVGPVQLIGADWVGRGRREHIRALLARFPRRAGHLRLLLLHDPSVFRHVPKGAADLTLSGHTHGGQLGLVSFGIDWTVLRRTAWPDHGLFGHGSNRLYVHRGTGFYGFPMRVGVPGEASLLEVVLA